MADKPIKVMLIEDNAGDARWVRETLAEVASTPFDWAQAEQLSTALPRLRAERFDVILADLSLPDSQGMATITALQAQAPDVPIVALSDLDDEALAVQAAHEGVQDYLVKGRADAHLISRALRYAIERKQAEAEILRRNAELATLNRIGQALTRLAEPTTILDLIYTMIGQVLDNRNLYIALYDEASQQIAFPVYTIEGERREAGSRPLGQGVTEYVIRTKAPLLIPSEVQATLTRLGIAAIGRMAQSLLAVPLLAGDKILGVIAVQDYQNPHVYTPAQAELLSTFAAWAAIALENARLYAAAQQELAERRRAEEALRESESRYRSLVELSPDAIGIHHKGRLVFANTAAARLLGAASPEQLMGRSVFEIVHPDYHAIVRQRVQQEKAGQPAPPLEQKLIRLDGTVVEVEVAVIPFTYNGKPAAQIIARDITERRQRQREQEAIVTVAAALRTAPTRAAMLPVILDQVMTLLNAEGAALDLRNPISGEITTELGCGAWANLTGRPRPPDKGLSDGPESEIENRYAVAGVPLVAQNEPLGALWVCRQTAFTDAEAHLLATVGDIAANALHRATLHEQTARRANELATLYETSRDLATQLNVPALLQAVVERATTLLGTASGGIYLYHAAQQDLELVVAKGFLAPLGTRLRVGEGMAGRVAQTRQPLIVNDYQTWEHRSPQYAGIPFTAVVEVPMLYSGELIGVLVANETAPARRQFTEAEARLLALFAAQAASAVYNARLFEVTRARAEQLALAYDAGLALNSVLEPRAQLELLFKIAMQALRADRAEYLRYVAAQNELRFEFGIGHTEKVLEALRGVSFPAGDERGLVGWVVQHRESLNVPDLLADPRYIVIDPELRSALWVPVEHERQLHGVFALLSTKVNAFTLQDEWLLGLFANQAAVALENAQSFAEAQRRAEELAAINTLSRALAETLDLPHIYAQLYDATGQILPDISSVFISLYDPERKLITCAYAVHDGSPLDVNELPPISLEAPGVGTQSEAIHTRRPLIISDLQARLRRVRTNITVGTPGPVAQSGLYVPMLAKGRVIGVVQVQSYTLDRFSQTDAELLSFVANTAAIAIENARLFAETGRRLENMQALRVIDTAITSSFDVRVTLNVLLDQAIRRLGVHAADILLLNKHAQTLEYAVGRGFRGSGVTRVRVRLGEGAAGRAALERRTIMSDGGQVIAKHGTPPAARHPSLATSEGFVVHIAAPLVARGQIKGVLEIFHRAALEPDQEWSDFLESLAGQAAIAIDNSALFEDLQHSNVELTLAYDATIEGWSRALDLRDRETEGHTQRVTDLTLRLARTLGMKDEELVHVQRGALLHDIGKMGIPDGILLKPGPLTDEEWAIMRLHPGYAYEMLAAIAYLRPALDIPYCHHEKWDGTGYPRGLKGEQIPLAARIFAVADVWDALRSDRPYRPAWPEEKVREHIRAGSGTHFDPNIVEAFLKL